MPASSDSESAVPQAHSKHQPDSASRLAFTLRETAGLLGISYVSVHRLIKRGLLRPNRALRHKLVSRAEIERFLAEGAEGAE